MLLHRDGARFPPDLMIGIQEFSLCFTRPENLVSHGLRVLQVPFDKLQEGFHVPLTEKWLSSASSRKSLDGSKLLLFENDVGRISLVPFLSSVPQHNPVSELYGQFLRHHGLVFALTGTVYLI